VRPQRPLYQGQSQAFGFERFRDVMTQAYDQKRYKDLARASSVGAAAEWRRRTVSQERSLRQFPEQRSLITSVRLASPPCTGWLIW